MTIYGIRCGTPLAPGNLDGSNRVVTAQDSATTTADITLNVGDKVIDVLPSPVFPAEGYDRIRFAAYEVTESGPWLQLTVYPLDMFVAVDSAQVFTRGTIATVLDDLSLAVNPGAAFAEALVNEQIAAQVARLRVTSE